MQIFRYHSAHINTNTFRNCNTPTQYTQNHFFFRKNTTITPIKLNIIKWSISKKYTIKIPQPYTMKLKENTHQQKKIRKTKQ